MRAHLDGVDKEMMNHTVPGRDAEQHRVGDVHQFELLRVGQRQSNRQRMRRVIEHGNLELQLLSSFHRVRQMQFDEERLEGFDVCG